MFANLILVTGLECLLHTEELIILISVARISYSYFTMCKLKYLLLSEEV